MATTPDAPIKNYLGQTDDIPTDELIVIKITDKTYGRKANILVSCEIENTDISFTFSVWSNQCYMPRDKKICFKPDEVIGKRFEAVFKRTKSYYLDIQSAKALPYSKEEIGNLKVGDIIFGEWGCEGEEIYHLRIDEMYSEKTTFSNLTNGTICYSEEYAKIVLNDIENRDLKYLCVGVICPRDDERVPLEIRLNSQLEDIDDKN